MRIAGSAPKTPREVAPGVFCLGPSGLTRTNVYFVRSGSSWVLVDAGWPSDEPRIARAARSLLGDGARPTAILLTHDHPDHEGSARGLANTWGCPVFLHPAELPIATRDLAAMATSAGPLDRWVVLPVMRVMGRRRREAAFARTTLKGVARALEPGSTIPGLRGWQCVPTPGHTPGHVSYFRPSDRVLISGDALVTLKIDTVSGLLLQRRRLSGPPWYTTWSRRAAAESVRKLVALRPAVLAPGHGEPATGDATAMLLRAFQGTSEAP